MIDLIVALILLQLATEAILVFVLWSLARFPFDVANDIRSTLRHLTDLTEGSLKVRGGSFEAFSPHELITQAAKVEECRERHAEHSAKGGDVDDPAFELEGAEDVLGVMLAGNRDAGHPGVPYWTRQRVHERANEFQPNGRKWKEHQARRESRLNDSRRKVVVDQ